MPLNNISSPISNVMYNPLFNPSGFLNNIQMDTPSILISNISNLNNSPIQSFINYEYEEEEISNMEEGLHTHLFDNFDKKIDNQKNLFTFSFNDRGKKIKKIVM